MALPCVLNFGVGGGIYSAVEENVEIGGKANGFPQSFQGQLWLQVAERLSKETRRRPSVLQAWLCGLGLVARPLCASISLFRNGNSVKSAKTTMQNSSVLFSVAESSSFMCGQVVDHVGHFRHEDRVLASKGKWVGMDGSREENLVAKTPC